MARPRQIALSSWILFVSAVTLSLMSGRATAQDPCACSPSKYTFTLDFSLTCPPVNIERGEETGVEATFCQINSFGDDENETSTIKDLVPVVVESIDVVELGQDLQTFSQKIITAGTSNFTNGDSFTFTPMIGEDNDIPKVIQLNIFALNGQGESIVNFFAISFSNKCDTFPVLSEGNSAGWTQFTKLEPPTAEQCPGVSSGKTVPPTDAPSVPPTDAPSVPPTDAPSVPPTDARSVPPTDAPFAPSVPPTEVMSMSMSMSMDLTAQSRAFFRLADIADASDIMYEKSEKSAKSEKQSKKAKYEKSEKSDKSEKSHKKDKSDKESKKEKTEKKRRLRVRPIYEAV